jgi:8-oxo-dGTP pyrophosphatase MutT (NUDIX family)
MLYSSIWKELSVLKNHNSVVLILGPDGQTPLVSEYDRRPSYWKFPGGKSHLGENPMETALREVREETGLILTEGETILLLSEPRSSSHVFHFFLSRINSFDGLIKRGNDGEYVALFEVDQLLKMVDLLPTHHRALEAYLSRRQS